MTVQELLDKIINNCPPNCPFPVKVSDNLTGSVGSLKDVRIRHNGRNMVVDLVIDGDRLEVAS